MVRGGARGGPKRETAGARRGHVRHQRPAEVPSSVSAFFPLKSVPTKIPTHMNHLCRSFRADLCRSFRAEREAAGARRCHVRHQRPAEVPSSASMKITRTFHGEGQNSQLKPGRGGGGQFDGETK